MYQKSLTPSARNAGSSTSGAIIALALIFVVGGIIKHEFFTWDPFAKIKVGQSMNLVEARLGPPMDRGQVARPR